MKTMRTLFLNIFLLVAAVCNAQTTISIDQLNGTKWEMIEPSITDEIIKAEYTDTVFKLQTDYTLIKKSAENTYKYYLSPTVPSSFDFSMVGKKTVGSYLIGYNSKMNEMFYYRIISFTPEKLVLLRKGKPNSIGAGEDLYMTYQRIK